jgi:hypothetical protein
VATLVIWRAIVLTDSVVLAGATTMLALALLVVSVAEMMLTVNTR